MMTDRPVTTAALVTAFGVLLFLAFLADPHASPQQPAGSGTITGVVVAADTGAPVKRANVTLMGPMGVPMRRPDGVPPGVVGSVIGGVPGGVVGGVGISSQMTMDGSRSMPATQTNEAGQFEFGNLAPGRYSVMIAPAGGFVRPDRPLTVEVAEGKPATLTVKLERTGAITGRVLDEAGEPLMQARVSAVRKDGPGGPRYAAGGATTDDLGHFRIFNLPPGDYYVNARHTTFAPSNARGPSEGYGATFYPGVPSLDGAQVVNVRPGQDAGNVDFSLLRVPLGRIVGTLRDGAGQPAPRPGPGVMVNVMITSTRKDGLGESRSGMVQQDGSYAITAIEPGEYVLNATITRGTGPDALREGAVVPVTVNGTEQNVDITTNLGATLSGRVVIEGTPPQGRRGAPPQALRVNVSARPLPGSMGGAVATGRPATANEDGTFEITGVRGDVLLSASGGPIVKSISAGGADLLARPLQLRGTERISDILVTMTWETGRIEGSVTNERGEPALEAWVVVFSEDESQWALGMPYVHLTRTLSEMPPPPPPGVTLPPSFQRRLPGSFVGMPLLPGRYYVAAVEGSRETFLRPEEPTLSKLRKVAVSVTVPAGGPTPVHLRAVKSF